MKFSLNYLKKLVDLSSISTEELVKRLTFASFEVEEVLKPALATNLVIGKIIECEKHPKSDHLHLLKVDCGLKYGIKDIVCGAPNARVGIKVIVALPGANLSKIGVIIKESEILGYHSSGMCCSLVELGVDKSLLSTKQIEGIEEVNPLVEIGSENVLQILGLDDTILDINVLPNRLDCLSYLFMAKEIAALFNLKTISLKKTDISTISKSSLKVTSKTSYCKKISLLIIKDITKLNSTPNEIKEMLNASGIRSISPIVDLGNYIMLLTGQPVNMYDLDLIDGDVLVSSDVNDEFTSFDNKKYQLQKDDIVIKDSKKDICLAGIIASSTSLISEQSKSIAIEFASFYHANIRHTAKRLGLSSYSQQLFAKGVNPYMIDDVISLSIDIINSFIAEYKSMEITSFSNIDELDNKFDYSLSLTNSRLGSDYTLKEAIDLFSLYNIKWIVKDNENEFTLYPPIYRLDLKEQCDIDEELFRYYSASRIKLNLDNFNATKGELSVEKIEENKIRNLLISKGLYEIVSYTLIDEKKDKLIRVFDNDESYKVINPMTKDHEIIRSDLLPSMLEVISYNLNHFNKDFALFEISQMDLKDKENSTYLSIALVGNKKTQDNFNLLPYDFYDMKGIIISILNKLGINENRYALDVSKVDCFNPYCCADLLVNKKKVGSFGKIHPSLISENIFLCEINLSYLISLPGRNVKYKAIDESPLIRRDLSFLLKDNVTYLDIKNAILKDKDKYLKDVKFFDLFTSNDGSKYLGISLYMSKDNETMSDSEITNCFNKAIEAVINKLGLQLRR